MNLANTQMEDIPVDPRHYSFPPVADGASRLLILGSLPGPVSLREQQYYGMKQNAFWQILYELLGEAPKDSYAEKMEMLHRHQIALWDIYQSAHRQGALDTAIKAPVPNDLPGFLRAHPRIGAILFNGGTAYAGFKRAFPQLLEQHPHRLVLSSSPACARKPGIKADNWRQALTDLDFLKPSAAPGKKQRNKQAKPLFGREKERQ